jgi:hypothetical protein
MDRESPALGSSKHSILISPRNLTAGYGPWGEGIGTNENCSVLAFEGEPVSFILRRFVAGVAVFFGLLVYASLRQFPWGIDAAICVGFTIEVIGLVATARILATPPLKPLRPAQQMLMIHGGFLLGAIAIERSFPLLQLLLPGGPVQHGRQGSWAMLVAVIVITVLGYAERWVLLHAPSTPNSLPWESATASPSLPTSGSNAAPANAPLVNGVPAPAPATGGFSSAFSFASAPAALTPAAVSPAQPTAVASASVAAAPVAVTPAASAAAAPSLYMNSSGDDFEEFRLHLSQPKRPFRKPGISVKEEYELWLAAKSLGSTPAVKPPRSGLSKFLLGEKAE